MFRNIGPFELLIIAIPFVIIYKIFRAVSKPVHIPDGPLSDADRMMHYDALKKNPSVIYAIWFFLGWLGAHRVMAGKTGSGFAMCALWLVSLLLSFVGVGLFGFFALGIWWFIDLFLIGGWIRNYNEALIAKLGMQKASATIATA